MRILHVFGRVGCGGAEVWLLEVLRRIDRDRFHFDFLVHRSDPGELDSVARDLGADIHVVEGYRNPPRYAAGLRRLLTDRRYHAIHSHVAFYSGYVLTLARALGVPSRIAHSHTGLPETGDSPWRTAYKQTMRLALHASTTRGLGCSTPACASLFGPRWRRRSKYEVLHYGYDYSRFAAVTPEARARVRAELGLADGHLAIGHIGRFFRPKNHDFLVELIAASHARGRHHERFILVGDGELAPRVKQQIESRGLAGKCVLTGRRSDIPALLAAFDVLVLPSRWEGLPVVILEAQAAGVKCILSDRVTDEVIRFPDHVTQRPIDRVEPWLDALDDMRRRPDLDPEAARKLMNASDFGIEPHVARIEALYWQELLRSPASRRS